MLSSEKCKKNNWYNIIVDGKVRLIYIRNLITSYLFALYLMLCEKGGTHHATCVIVSTIMTTN